MSVLSNILVAQVLQHITELFETTEFWKLNRQQTENLDFSLFGQKIKTKKKGTELTQVTKIWIKST